MTLSQTFKFLLAHINSSLKARYLAKRAAGEQSKSFFMSIIILWWGNEV